MIQNFLLIELALKKAVSLVRIVRLARVKNHARKIYEKKCCGIFIEGMKVTLKQADSDWLKSRTR